MTRYEDRFDSDWDSLDRGEAVRRAFALGVSAALGEPDDEEYEAILAAMSTTYETSLVELAYQEGKHAVGERRRVTDADTDDDAIWERVISEELDDVRPPDRDVVDDADRATDLPSAVRDRVAATDRPDLDPEQTEFPDFLE